jgi:HSP20 family protein
MANISVRKDENRHLPLSTSWDTRWDPFRVMRDLLDWDPFREMSALTPRVAVGFDPAFEVKETKEGFSFKADVPGIKDNDLDVTLTGNRLTISGKREAEKQEHTDNYYAHERTYGDFMRAFTLPEGVDASSVHADLKDGVLTVTIRKTPEAQPKRVEIQSSVKKS